MSTRWWIHQTVDKFVHSFFKFRRLTLSINWLKIVNFFHNFNHRKSNTITIFLSLKFEKIYNSVNSLTKLYTFINKVQKIEKLTNLRYFPSMYCIRIMFFHILSLRKSNIYFFWESLKCEQRFLAHSDFIISKFFGVWHLVPAWIYIRIVGRTTRFNLTNNSILMESFSVDIAISKSENLKNEIIVNYTVINFQSNIVFFLVSCNLQRWEIDQWLRILNKSCHRTHWQYKR